MKTKRLTKAQMRVEIAKDVIKQVEAQKFVPTQGNYITPLEINPDWPLKCEVNKTHIDRVLTNNVSNCHVCAVGATMLSALHLYNKISYTLDSHPKTVLHKWFTIEQTELIEGYFEQWSQRKGVLIEHEIYKEKNSAMRLIMIMRNIIKNKGTFKP